MPLAVMRLLSLAHAMRATGSRAARGRRRPGRTRSRSRAASRIAAHVTSNRSALDALDDDPAEDERRAAEVLPTIAPMRLSVVATLSAVKKNGSAFGTRTLRRTVPLGRGVGAHQLERGRVDLDQAAGHVDHHREEDEDRGHHHLDSGFSEPEPVVHERGERDDRDRVRGDREREQRRPGRSPSARSRRPRATPAAGRRSPARRRPRSNVACADGSRPNRATFRFSTSAVDDGRRPRQDERLEAERRRRRPPRRRCRRGTRATRRQVVADAGAPSAAARARPGRATGRDRHRPSRSPDGALGQRPLGRGERVGSSPSRPPSRPRSASRTAVTSSK